MTNNVLWAVVVVAMISGAACAPAHQEFEVAGVTPPTAATGGLCTFTPNITTELASGTLFLNWQKAVSPELHYLTALTLINGITLQPLMDANGHLYTNLHQGDIQVTEVDATFSAIGNGPSVPDVQVPATGYIANLTNGVTSFDLLSSDASAALSKATKPFTLLASITVKGLTGGSSPVQTSPFQFPIQIDFAPVPFDPGTADPCGTATDAVGNPLNGLSFPNGPCGNAQDTASATCVSLTDGGA